MRVSRSRSDLSTIKRNAIAYGLCLIGLGLGGALEAQTPVRSGEHGDFTRVVVDFERRPDWRLGRTADGYELRTEGRGVFDLTGVFRRIDTNRLRDVRNLGDGDLAFDVDCICRLEVFELPNQGLMIDIVDGSPAPDDPYEIALDAAAPPPRPARRQNAEILPVVLPEQPTALRFGPLQAATPNPLSAEEIDQKTAVRRALLEQIAHGMSQGLVTARNPLPAATASSVRIAEDVAPPPPLPRPSGPNIRVETQIDRDQRLGAGQRTVVPEGTCLPGALMDVGSWFNTDLLVQGPGATRQALYDPRDRPDKAAHRTLVRQLIFMTFGAEARALLRQGAVEGGEAAVLDGIAALMDDEPIAQTSPLLEQLGCDSPGALWALLAHDAPPFGRTVDTKAAVAALSSWPPHLRQHLGPRVASALLDLGRRDAALAVRNAISRGAPPPSPATTMVEAELDLDNGDHDRAEVKLAEVATTRSDEAADAMVELLRSRIATGVPVPQGFMTSAQAMAFEVKNSAAAKPLWTALIEAKILNAAVEDAQSTLQDAKRRGLVDDKTAARLRNMALARLTETAGDADFLRVILPELAAAPLAPPARLPTAERLAELRMPAQARQALGAQLDVPKPRERILLARIALLEDKPRIAESYLTGLSDPEAETLMARAAALPDVPPRANGTPPSVDPNVGQEATTGVIAENRLLLEESRARRAVLDALLAPNE